MKTPASILLLAMGVFSRTVQAQSTGTAALPDLSKWSLICYCVTSVGTPHPIVRADDNGQILYFARDGATREQIQDALHPPAISSQLLLLRDWRLLTNVGVTYKTAIPVLGPEKTAALRQRMGELGAEDRAQNGSRH